MKYLLGFFLIIGSLCGLAISFLGNIVVNSSLLVIDGMDLSTGLLAFSVLALINGLLVLFLNS